MMISIKKFFCLECLREQHRPLEITDDDTRLDIFKKLTSPPDKCENPECPTHKMDPYVLAAVDAFERASNGFTDQQREDAFDAEMKRRRNDE